MVRTAPLSRYLVEQECWAATHRPTSLPSCPATRPKKEPKGSNRDSSDLVERGILQVCESKVLEEHYTDRRQDTASSFAPFSTLHSLAELCLCHSLHIGLLALSYPVDSKHHFSKNCEHSFFAITLSLVLNIVAYTNETVHIYL